MASTNKVKLISGNSKFNLLCMPSDNFPLSEDDNDKKKFDISSEKLLKLLNKTKVSISNDETRHYLNGIYLHKTKLENKMTPLCTMNSYEMGRGRGLSKNLCAKTIIFHLLKNDVHTSTHLHYCKASFGCFVLRFSLPLRQGLLYAYHTKDI